MSSIYNKGYIKKSEEKRILDMLEGRTNYLPNPNNLKERYGYIIFQHYLVKYIEEHGKTPRIKEIINKYFEDFTKYPHLFVDSPLLDNRFIDRFMPLKLRVKTHMLKFKYYESNDNKKLYDSLIKGDNLSKENKNKLYSFLLYQMRKNYNKYSKEIENCAKLILNSNKKVQELSDIELKFYCTFVAKRAGYDKVFPDIHIIDDKPSRNGFELHNIVYINKHSDNVHELFEITKTVCHETRHAIQEKDSKNKNSRIAFEMARHLLFNKYLNTDVYNVYDRNYRYSGIELDADDYGYYYSKVLLQTLDRSDLSDKVQRMEINNHYKRHYYEFIEDINGMMISPDIFTVQHMDAIIKKHPSELNNYKALNNLYNKDGSRKSLGELITLRVNQSHEDRGLYDNYINYEISKNRLFNIDLVRTPSALQEKLFKSLSNICSDKVTLFLDYCNDDEYKNVDTNQIRVSTLYQINLLDNLYNYIDQHMEYIMTFKESNTSTENSFIYNYLRDFRHFNINNIKNEVIKNDPEIRSRVNSLLNKYNNIVKKNNESYIKEAIQDLTIEQKHSVITTPEGNKTQLIDYLYFDLLPRLDAQTMVNLNGKITHASSIIKFYKEQLKNKGSNIHI